MTLSKHFKGVTLLVTHFNRSLSLERQLKAFHSLNCLFEEIVVSDDCSNADHLAFLQKLQIEYGFRLITTEKNRGLANNINKGQDAVNTNYTLYVQEDFIPTEKFPASFKDALRVMDERADLDIIRFYSYLPYPYTIPYRDGFSEMQFKAWGTKYHKIYVYSDHPHLRRSNFFKKFGRYIEKIPSDRAEYWMCISFLQNKGKSILYDCFKSLFEQYNPLSEPSTVKRQNWTLSSNILISTIRYFYRQVRYNYDIHFTKKHLTNYK